jgi:hypothetical protein
VVKDSAVSSASRCHGCCPPARYLRCQAAASAVETNGQSGWYANGLEEAEVVGVGDAARTGVVGSGVVGIGVGVVDGRVDVVLAEVVLAKGKGTAGWPESDSPPRNPTASPDRRADSTVTAAAAATIITARVRRVVRRSGSGSRPGSWSGSLCVMAVSL